MIAPLVLTLILTKQIPSTPKVVRLSGHFQVLCYAKEPNAKLRFPLPLQTEFQTPLSFQFQPGTNRLIKFKRVIKGDLDNWLLEVEFKPLSKSEKIDIKWDSDVAINVPTVGEGNTVVDSPPMPAKYPREVASWTLPSVWVQSDDRRIVAIANRIKRPTVLETVDAALKECSAIDNRARIRVGDEWKDRESNNCGAVQALTLKGSCTSKANLFAAILRSAGIPARTVAGYLETRQPLETHYMVDFYMEGFGWRRIDPSGYPASPDLFFPVAVNSLRSESYVRGNKVGAADGVPLNSLNETDGSILTFAINNGAHSARVLRNEIVETERIPALRLAWTDWLNQCIQSYSDLGRPTR